MACESSLDLSIGGCEMQRVLHVVGAQQTKSVLRRNLPDKRTRSKQDQSPFEVCLCPLDILKGCWCLQGC